MIGLTGVYGAGKSAVAGLFRKFGAYVIDADRIVRDLTGPGSPVVGRIEERFGARVAHPGGGLDRRVLADIVFADKAARTWLEELLHPMVFREAERFRSSVRVRDPHGLIVFEAPLLIEAGYHRTVRGVVVVRCDEGVIIARARAAGVPEEEVRRRWAAQMSQDDKCAYADWVVDNSGSTEETEVRVAAIIEEVRNAGPA